MRLLIWLITIGAVALAVWYVASRPRYRRQMRTLADLSWATLSLVLLVAVVYAAHSMGIFSIPLVALAFVPIGIVARWLLVATRGPRERSHAQVSPVSGGIWDKLALPMLVLMVAAVAVLGVVVGTIVGPH